VSRAARYFAGCISWPPMRCQLASHDRALLDANSDPRFAGTNRIRSCDEVAEWTISAYLSRLRSRCGGVGYGSGDQDGGTSLDGGKRTV